MFTLFAVGQALVMPVYLTSLLLIYFDVRIRKEGWDLEQVAQGLENRGDAGSGDIPHSGEAVVATPEARTPEVAATEG
jgi:hypothetical protein